MPRRSTVAMSLALAAGLTACQPPAPSAPVVDTTKAIVTVNDEAITEGEIDHFLKFNRPPIKDNERAKELALDTMIGRALLSQYAVDSALDQEVDVHLMLARQREEVLIAAARRHILKNSPEIKEEEVKARYDKEIEQTHKTEYQAQHIMVKTEADAQALIADLKKGQKFSEVAKTKSKDASTAEKGGELGWVRQGAVVDEFFAAVSNLKKGEFTQAPVRTSFGWHIIKLKDTRKLSVAPYEKVRGDVVNMLQNQRISQKVVELRKTAKIQMN